MTNVIDDFETSAAARVASADFAREQAALNVLASQERLDQLGREKSRAQRDVASLTHFAGVDGHEQRLADARATLARADGEIAGERRHLADLQRRASSANDEYRQVVAAAADVRRRAVQARQGVPR